MKKSKNFERKIFCLVFIIASFLCALSIAGIVHHQKHLHLEHADYLLNLEANNIQYAIDFRMLKLQSLEMVVIANENSVNRFDDIAADLCDNDICIENLFLAPGGKISYQYPADTDSMVVTAVSEILDAPAPHKNSSDKEKISLLGPYEFSEGQTDFIVQYPIYLPSTNEQLNLWGYGFAVMDIKLLFTDIQFMDLNNSDYSYAVWKYNDDSSKKEVLIGSADFVPPDGITKELSFPGRPWYLTIVPSNGWIPGLQLFLYIIAALFITLLITFLAYYFILSEIQKRKLDQLAHTDALTGLYNTRFLNTTFEQLIKQKQPFSLFVLDMNKFKQVNDTYGHKAGDMLLTETAHRLQQCIRDIDFAFRIGGDEFSLIILQKGSAVTCDELTATIKQSIREPIQIDDITLHMDTSCGYASYPSEADQVKTLFQLADERMYKDKESNR